MERISSRAVVAVIMLTATVWLLGVPATALGQSAPVARSQAVGGLGYGFIGLGAVTGDGGSTGTWHAGGGGEVVIRDAFGIGAEIGHLGWLEEDGSGLGVFSVNGSYHFSGGPASRRLRPFVTGGYTLGFAEGDQESLFNFGGGADYWLKPNVGLRIEFRDHVWAGEGETLHFWGVRFGVTFR